MLAMHVPTLSVIDEHALEALSLVIMDYSDAFLAGGYIRDKILFRKPKDIDVFTFKAALPERVLVSNDNMEAGDGLTSAGMDSRVLAVERIENSSSGLMVEIVHLDPKMAQLSKLDPQYNAETWNELSVEEAVKQFGFGMQQVWYDFDADKIRYTPLFEQDIERKSMTVARTEHPYEAAALWSKYKSIRMKYPDWKLRIPHRFKEFWLVALVGLSEEELNMMEFVND